jgi:hypothetical protein
VQVVSAAGAAASACTMLLHPPSFQAVTLRHQLICYFSVFMLCCSAGGLSSWSSSISVHNEILRSRPDLAQVLAGPHWFYDRKGEVCTMVFLLFIDVTYDARILSSHSLSGVRYYGSCKCNEHGVISVAITFTLKTLLQSLLHVGAARQSRTFSSPYSTTMTTGNLKVM